MSPASTLVVTYLSDQLAGYLPRGLKQSKGGKVVKNCKSDKKVIEVVEKLKIPAKSTCLSAFLLSLYHPLCLFKKSHPNSKNLR